MVMTLPDAGVLTIIVGALGAFGSAVSSLILQIIQYKSRGRDHQWAVEQADRDRKERLETASQLKRQHADTAMQLATTTTIAAQQVIQKIDENTAVNEAALKAGEKAYIEANNLTLKIAQQGLQLRAPARATDHKDEA